MTAKFNDSELRILRLLNERTVVEGVEVLENVGDLDKARTALKRLERLGVLHIKGNIQDEKEFYYSTVVASPSNIKRAMD